MHAFIDSPQEWAIILIVVLVLFGGSQLPKLARNLGQAQKEFKKGLAEGQKDKDKGDTKSSTGDSSAAD